MPLIAIVLWCRQTLTNQCRHTWRVSTTGERDRARRLVLMVGVVVLGLAVALGIFIQYQSRDPRPPEDVARALAIPAQTAVVLEFVTPHGGVIPDEATIVKTLGFRP